MSSLARDAVMGNRTETGMSGPNPRDIGPSSGAYFPFGFVSGFLDFLVAHRGQLEPITYADLEWGDDYDGENRYPQERARWRERSEALRAAGRTQVLIQHDVDARPHRTHAVIEAERERRIPSNVMIFHQRVDRPRLKARGELALTEYPVDGDLLREAEEEGFVIGYHFNAMERALWDQDRAREIFTADLRALRDQYTVEFVSAHGGVVGPDGSRNRHLVSTDLRALGSRWVHNGQSPGFTASYSDGGLNDTKLDPAGRDLRDFVRSIEPGGRYRVLLHPQYYSSPCEPAHGLTGTHWYDALLALHAAEPEADSWADVELSWGP